MKSLPTFIAIAFGGLLVQGCKRPDIVTYLDTQTATGMANLKIIHASPYTINYPVVIKVNDIRVSNNVTNTTPFPGGGLNTGGSNTPWYLALKPGRTQIALSVPKVGSSIDSIPLYSGMVNLAADQYYSAYFTDTAANTRIVFVTENISTPAVNTTRFKFVNLIPNQPALDLYAGANKVASNIAYANVSPDFTLNRGDTVRFYARPAGSPATTAPVAFYPTFAGANVNAPITVPNQRVMTVFARGYSGGTGNKAPAISLLYNY